jgi:hypothetical protein
MNSNENSYGSPSEVAGRFRFWMTRFSPGSNGIEAKKVRYLTPSFVAIISSSVFFSGALF